MRQQRDWRRSSDVHWAKLYEAEGSSSTDGKTVVETESSKKKTEQGVLATFLQVVNHLLEIYATDDVIGEEEDNDILRFSQTTN